MKLSKEEKIIIDDKDIINKHIDQFIERLIYLKFRSKDQKLKELIIENYILDKEIE